MLLLLNLFTCMYTVDYPLQYLSCGIIMSESVTVLHTWKSGNESMSPVDIG